MDWKKLEGQKGIFIISVAMIGSFLLAEFLSIAIFGDTSDIKYLLRIYARGILGVLAVYHGSIMLFTKKVYYLTKNNTRNQSRFAGVLLLLLGIGMVVTAIAGYGMNGDPRYIWWN